MDHLQRSLLNQFAVQPLDRMAHQRSDSEWLLEQAKSPNAVMYITHNGAIAVHEHRPVVLNNTHPACTSLPAHRVFLGCEDQKTPVFTANIDDLKQLEPHFPPITPVSLRELASKLDTHTASILAYALLMNRWHHTTRFCRQCGAALNSTQGGHVLECVSPDCGHVEFPRINPAVIMRVHSGDSILLARQQSWPDNRYSVLAGFVEPGETLEHAVQREVAEEAGLVVDRVEYHSSQPWPFPNSLMLGYSAWTNDKKLEIENDDLETALWVNAEQLTDHMNEGSIILSPPISISHRLIEDWFMQQTGRSIKEWQEIEPEHIR